MCYVEAKTDVRIRKGPGTSYGQVGTLHPGHSLQSACHPTSGEYYRDCGGSYWWIEVYYNGDWGYYVAYGCVHFYWDQHSPDDHHDAVEAIRAEEREATVPPTPEPAPALEG